MLMINEYVNKRVERGAISGCSSFLVDQYLLSESLSLEYAMTPIYYCFRRNALEEIMF